MLCSGSEGADMPVLEACLEQHCYARSQASHHLLLSINESELEASRVYALQFSGGLLQKSWLKVS